MAITNPSFEDVGATASEADGWTRVEVSSFELRATFEQDDAPNRDDSETFSGGWASNEDYLFAFDSGDVQTAIFDTMIGGVDGAEDFEDGWDSNQSYAFDMGSDEAAQFDSNDYEDFEDGWASNESYLFNLTSSSVAVFDSENYEDFEEGWQGTYLYAFAGGDVSAALFLNAPASLAAYEGFIGVYNETQVSFNAGSDLVLYTAHPLSLNEIVTLRPVGDGARLPGGIAAGIHYYVVNPTTNNFQLSLTPGGTAIDLEDSGAGTNYISRTPFGFWIVKVDEPLGV
jgi:hypothetical protein